MAAAARKATGREIPYEIRPRRAGDIAACYADPAIAAEKLGWRAERGLEQMVAEEVRYCHTTGAVDTKTSYLETVRTGGISWLEVNPIGMEARIYGDVGIIAGEVKQKITVSGRAEPIDMHIRTIDVYIKRDGRWQLTEFQASNVR